MNLSHHEALAILRKLKGSSVYLRLGLTGDDDPSLGALRVSAEAMLEECDETSVLLTWPHNGQMRLMLEGASFRVPITMKARWLVWRSNCARASSVWSVRHGQLMVSSINSSTVHPAGRA